MQHHKGCSLFSLLTVLSALWISSGCVPEDPEPTLVCDLICDSGDYPPPPYGTATCETINDLCFEAANEQALALAGDDGTFSMSDLFADESVVGILLFGTAGWCQFCTQEASWLNAIYPELQDIDGEGHRIEVVAVVFEDDFGATATRDYAEAYASYKGLIFPAVSDSCKWALDYFDASAAPGNIFISREGMNLEQVLQGFDQDSLERALNALDAPSTCR